MAAANSTRARGIQIRDYAWGRIIEGTREMLIQHGYTLDGTFPGDPGARKTVERGTDPAGRVIKIQRKSTYIFSIRRDWNEGEAAAYRAAEEAQRARIEDARQAKLVVDSWPESAGDYRGRVHRYVVATMEGVERLLDAGRLGGYRFDDVALGRLYEISDDLRELVEAGGIGMDPELRKKWTPDCIGDELPVPDTPAPEAAGLGGNVIPFRRMRNR